MVPEGALGVPWRGRRQPEGGPGPGGDMERRGAVHQWADCGVEPHRPGWGASHHQDFHHGHCSPAGQLFAF